MGQGMYNYVLFLCYTKLNIDMFSKLYCSGLVCGDIYSSCEFQYCFIVTALL